MLSKCLLISIYLYQNIQWSLQKHFHVGHFTDEEAGVSGALINSIRFVTCKSINPYPRALSLGSYLCFGLWWLGGHLTSAVFWLRTGIHIFFSVVGSLAQGKATWLASGERKIFPPLLAGAGQPENYLSPLSAAWDVMTCFQSFLIMGFLIGIWKTASKSWGLDSSPCFISKSLNPDFQKDFLYFTLRESPICYGSHSSQNAHLGVV